MRRKSPFWLPASSYYVLVAAAAAGSFFLVIGLFSDRGTEVEWTTAGLVACGVLVGGVVLREVVLRSVRQQYILKAVRLDRNLRRSGEHSMDSSHAAKFTLEMNTEAIARIKKKAEAARVFDRISEGHREVFELCEEYQRVVQMEIPRVHPGSPRLKALTDGSKLAARVHKVHLLRWAELESKASASKAQIANLPEDRAAHARDARSAIGRALDHHPNEPALNASAVLLDELLMSIEVSDLVGQAEKAALEGENDVAIALYRKALKLIKTTDNELSRAEATRNIEQELLRLESD